MSTDPVTGISHIGVCVSDTDRSIRFYTEALGFKLSHSVDAGKPFHLLAELPEMKLRATFLQRDGLTIELLDYKVPGIVGPAERRPMNQLGLTHLALFVDNVDTATARIEKNGGRVYPHTRVNTPAGDMIYCTDPDGIRLELWNKPA